MASMKVGEEKKLKGYTGVYARRLKGSWIKNGKTRELIVYRIRYVNRAGRLVVFTCGTNEEGMNAEKARDIRNERIMLERRGIDAAEALTPRTLGDIWKEYLGYLKAQDYRQHTVDTKISTWKKHIEPVLGGLSLAAITQVHVQKMVADMKEKKGMAPGSVAHALTLVRQLFEFAQNTGKYQGGNPAKLVKLRKTKVVRERYLSIDEIRRLLDATKQINQDAYVQVCLGLFMGMRKFEVKNLCWENINWERGTMTFVRKGGKVDTLPISSMVREPLLALGRKEKGRIFKKFERYHIARAIEITGLNNGVAARDTKNRVVFHTLRHTFSTHAERALGGNLRQVQQLMSHANLITTEGYTHLDLNAKADFRTGVDRYFSQHMEPTPVIDLNTRRKAK